MGDGTIRDRLAGLLGRRTGAGGGAREGSPPAPAAPPGAPPEPSTPPGEEPFGTGYT